VDPGAASAKKAREAAGKAKPKDDVLERGQLSAWFGAVRGIPTEWLLKVDGLVTNASTAIRFLRGDHADLLLMDMAGELRSQGEAVNRGDLAAAERMLNAQAVSLNAIFGELARRAALNMGEHLGATERYMRLAFKAQAQCRATVETLAEMKNPHSVAFVRQANIAHGPQQINIEARRSSTGEVAPAGETQSEQSKQLEVPSGEWLDTGAKSAAGGTDSNLAPMGEVNGAADESG